MSDLKRRLVPPMYARQHPRARTAFSDTSVILPNLRLDPIVTAHDENLQRVIAEILFHQRIVDVARVPQANPCVHGALLTIRRQKFVGKVPECQLGV